jgi:lysophospholipase L1-like esterase
VQPVTIGAPRLARRAGGSKVDPATSRALTFSGRPAITIPPGALVLSDPVKLEAPALSDLAVSFYLPGAAAASTVHYSAHQTSYALPGDATAALEAPEAPTLWSWPFLNGVDVLAPPAAGAIVAFGDSITDGSSSTADANRRWADVLARRLQAKPATRRISVVNAGLGGNRILHDGAGANGPQYGVNALARFERDALAQPGVKWIIALIGVNDIGHPGGAAPLSEAVTAEDMIAGLRQLAERAHERGVRIFGGTIMPFPHNPAQEAQRQTVNEWIRTSRVFDAVIDFDKVVRDPAEPSRYLPVYDSGDHLHPNDAGHEAMGSAVDLALFSR